MNANYNQDMPLINVTVTQQPMQQQPEADVASLKSARSQRSAFKPVLNRQRSSNVASSDNKHGGNNSASDGNAAAVAMGVTKMYNPVTAENN